MGNPIARLSEVAAQQHGLFTVARAAGIDVSDDQVRRMAATGVLERRAQGVYRISTAPFDEQTELMEAVLWAKGRGLIAGESGLLLWDLADVNPRKIHVAMPPGYRPVEPAVSSMRSTTSLSMPRTATRCTACRWCLRPLQFARRSTGVWPVT